MLRIFNFLTVVALRESEQEQEKGHPYKGDMDDGTE